MALLKSVITLLIVLMNISSAVPVKNLNHSVQGVVVDKLSGTPLSNIYLYTVKGEEEAISNNKGEFKITTWQKLPLTIYVHNKDGQDISIVVTNPKQYIKIKV